MDTEIVFTNQHHDATKAVFRKVPKIISHGKLPFSHYYDVIDPSLGESIIKQQSNSSSISCSPSTSTSSSPGSSPNQQQQLQAQQQNFNYDSRLEIWQCIFSPEGSHLAWSCGNGIIKLMSFRDAPRKRTCSQNIQLPGQQRTPLDYDFQKDQPPVQTPRSNSISIPFQAYQMPTSTATTISLLNHNSAVNIREIDCAELVWSLAFGSSASQLPRHHRTNKSQQSQRRVNTRFDLARHTLILAAGLASGKIRIYDAHTAQFLFVLFDHKDVVRHLAFSRDGSLQLASTSRDETIKLWNFYDDGNMYKTLRGHTGTVTACDWSPTAPLLCSVGVNRQAFVWDTTSHAVKHVLRGHLHDVVACEFSPDGALLATASFDTKIIAWNPYTGEPLRHFCHMLPPPRLIFAGGHNGAYVRSLAFSSSGDHLVSLCDDKKLRMWSLAASAPVAEGAHVDGLCCAYAPSSRVIMVGTRKGHVEMFEVPAVALPSLKHMCRRVVNQLCEREHVASLHLPAELKRYLVYDDIKQKL